MATTKCKTCRRNGQKLFLKGEKCWTAKCPLVRKPYPPGKRAKRPSPISEYGLQLREKQKLKFMYGLREREFANYIEKSMRKKGGMIAFRLMEFLESRLDNVVFRLGFARSRSVARQLVSHGHILVNNKKVDIPSFLVKKGDKISIRPQSLSSKVFQDLDIWLKKYDLPGWLKLDKDKKEGLVLRPPQLDEMETGVDLNLIIEFYSR